MSLEKQVPVNLQNAKRNICTRNAFGALEDSELSVQKLSNVFTTKQTFNVTLGVARHNNFIINAFTR